MIASVRRSLLRLCRAAVLGLAALAWSPGARTAEATPPDPDPGMVAIPAGDYRPLFTGPTDPVTLPVAAFRLDVLPVTNADYLAFVRAQPKWRRSQVGPLFADDSYLRHWAGDLKLGPRAPAAAPVVQVSWFAARAYARWKGKRLPTTAEWERAAAVGYDGPDAEADETLTADIYRWLAQPTPAVLPAVTDARANALGVRALFGHVWEWVADFNTAMVTGESRADGGLERNLFCSAGSVGARDTGDYPAFMRMALRSSLVARNTTSSLGFRCAADLPPAAADPADIPSSPPPSPRSDLP